MISNKRCVKASDSEAQLTGARQVLGEKDDLIRSLESERVIMDQERETLSQALSDVRLKAQAIEIEINRLQGELQTRDATEACLVEYELCFGHREAAETRLARIQTRIERLGPINLVALDEYQKELERKAELDHQYAELTEALKHSKVRFEQSIERLGPYSVIRSMQLTNHLAKSFRNYSVVVKHG